MVRRCGRGDLALANSRVGASLAVRGGAAIVGASEINVSVASSDPTGAPQAEQKRLVIGTSAVQAVHRDMNFTADSVTRSSRLRKR